MSPRQRLVVGGGIGSGKSTVIGALSRLGWFVVSGDEIGHDVLRDSGVIGAVAERWPGVVINGEISRPALARIVFDDPRELSRLEQTTHPLIGARIGELVKHSAGPIAVEVSVLKLVDPEWGQLILVYAPRGLRRERSLARGMQPADVDARMAVQPSDSELLARADVVLDNQGTAEDLEAAVHRIDAWIRP